MGILRFADPKSVKRYERDGDWIDVHASLSRGQMNQLLDDMPDAILGARPDATDEGAASLLVLRETPKLSQALFRALVVAWSMDNDPSIEDYLALEQDAAQWVDSVLYDHLNAMNAERSDPKKPMTSPKGSRRTTPASN